MPVNNNDKPLKPSYKYFYITYSNVVIKMNMNDLSYKQRSLEMKYNYISSNDESHHKITWDSFRKYVTSWQELTQDEANNMIKKAWNIV